MHQEILARGICVKDSKILLAYFKPKSYYFLPGGHVEHGESVLTALEREIKEELGIDASAKKVVNVFEHTWTGKNGLVHELNFYILFSIDNNSQLNSLVDHLEFSWVPINDLLTINFLPAEIKDTVIKIASSDENVPLFKSSIRV